MNIADSPMISALLVTVIGMVVVFVAMALFYVSMHILTGVTRDKDKRGGEADSGSISEDTSDRSGRALDRLRTAAIAVALARATSNVEPEEPAELTSQNTPWGDFHRHRQLWLSGRGRIS